MVAADLGFSYEIALLPTSNTQELLTVLGNGTANVTLFALFEGTYGDPALAAAFEPTFPVVNSPAVALVLKTEESVGLFRFLDPFSSELWYAVAAVVAVVAAAVVASRAVLDGCGGGTPASWAARTVHACFSALSAFLGADSYDWSSKLVLPGRVLRLAVLFFVLVSVSTYTANLAAFLTRPAVTVHGPKDIAELADSSVCSGALPLLSSFASDGSWADFFANLTVPESDGGRSVAERLEWCHNKLRRREVEAWVEPRALVHQYFLRNCATLHTVPSIEIAPFQTAFLFRKDLAWMARLVSASLLHLSAQPAWRESRDEYFLYDASCPETELAGADSEKVSLRQMSGLFVVFATVAASALALAAATRLRSGAEDSDARSPTAAVLR
eukprot:TRINITY_DN26300_c0_g1_i2.p1 TRINITY_DN26300_c0_g1~~TRINITY_DN26300_c0_g1_i2.p1  ORF type:complete len:453 (+),score=146.56 TRINITY_DN26300_c0_g1_i2:203-1360(+)